MNSARDNKRATEKATERRTSKLSSGGVGFELTVFTIATGKYLDYFNLQLPSLEKFLLPGLRVQIIVCTDRPQSDVAAHSDRFEIQVSPIEPLPWPEITLMRYREIWLRRHGIKSRNFLWLDADMRLEKTIFPQVTSRFESSIYLAKHPGFLFPQGKRMLTTHSLSVLLERLAYRLKNGHNLGAWEANAISQAFVPPRNRKRYVHGAVWGGDVSAVMEMVKVLMSRTNERRLQSCCYCFVARREPLELVRGKL
jgi:hypothetical protein